jgi:hypothetical protein
MRFVIFLQCSPGIRAWSGQGEWDHQPSGPLLPELQWCFDFSAHLCQSPSLSSMTSNEHCEHELDFSLIFWVPRLAQCQSSPGYKQVGEAPATWVICQWRISALLLKLTLSMELLSLDWVWPLASGIFAASQAPARSPQLTPVKISPSLHLPW